MVEGGTATFAVTRSGSGSESTVYVSTEPGTGLFFSATSGADFTVLDHKAVTFAANETVKTVSVNIVNDNVSEGNEKFYLVMNESASSSSKVSGVYDSVWITPASGALASQGAPNAGANSTDTVTVTSTSNYFSRL